MFNTKHLFVGLLFFSANNIQTNTRYAPPSPSPEEILQKYADLMASTQKAIEQNIEGCSSCTDNKKLFFTCTIKASLLPLLKMIEKISLQEFINVEMAKGNSDKPIYLPLNPTEIEQVKPMIQGSSDDLLLAINHFKNCSRKGSLREKKDCLNSHKIEQLLSHITEDKIRESTQHMGMGAIDNETIEYTLEALNNQEIINIIKSFSDSIQTQMLDALKELYPNASEEELINYIIEYHIKNSEALLEASY